MLNTENENKVESEEKASLENRRLEGILNGDFDWIGKGFLAVIKNDCDIPENPEHQNK